MLFPTRCYLPATKNGLRKLVTGARCRGTGLEVDGLVVEADLCHRLVAPAVRRFIGLDGVEESFLGLIGNIHLLGSKMLTG